MAVSRGMPGPLLRPLVLLAAARTATAQHLLTNLMIAPCLNDTLVPPFATDHYLYTTMEEDCTTAFVGITATPSAGVSASGVSILVDGKVAPASHVPLHNATDGPGPDTGTLIDVLVMSKSVTESYKVTVSRPLCPPKLWTLTADTGVLSPAFDPDTLNYTLTLPNASVDYVTFTDTFPMPTGRVAWAADGVSVPGASALKATVNLDADTVVVTIQASYVWHTEVGYAVYTVTVQAPPAPESQLSSLAVVPCLNSTLVPPFQPNVYNYETSEEDCTTNEVQMVTKQAADATAKVTVKGLVVDAMHVKLNNATDGPGPDTGTLIDGESLLLLLPPPPPPPLWQKSVHQLISG
jgi:hypothetical protein